MLTKAAVWRKWIRRVPEIGGLRGMAGVIQQAGKRHQSKHFTVYCSLAHKGLSSTHTYKWQRKNGVTNIITLPKLSET
jgi:hypothetical protein